MSDSTIIIKNTKQFKLEKREDTNHYSLSFSLQVGEGVQIESYLTLDLILLLYQLNPELFDYQAIERNPTTDSMKVLVLMKHLFKNLGLPQRYLYMNIERNQTVLEGVPYIVFTSSDLSVDLPQPFLNEIIVEDLAMLAPSPLQKCQCWCQLVNEQETYVVFHFSIKEEIEVTSFMEEMLSGILFQIFRNLQKYLLARR